MKIPIAIIVAGVLIGGTFMLARNNNDISSADIKKAAQGNNVSIVDGIQVIEINARGGYWPRKTVAKAGIPTVLRFNTVSTFDCSSVVRIPSMDISKILPQTGSTDIDVGVKQTSVLKGSCGMGMYPFEVEFQG